jgi:hypothetical protein
MAKNSAIMGIALISVVNKLDDVLHSVPEELGDAALLVQYLYQTGELDTQDLHDIYSGKDNYSLKLLTKILRHTAEESGAQKVSHRTPKPATIKQ